MTDSGQGAPAGRSRVWRAVEAAAAVCVFAAGMVLVWAAWAFSGMCENDCSGPPSLSHKLAYLAAGAIVVVVSLVIRNRWVWILGALLLFHGCLITVWPTVLGTLPSGK